MTIRKSYLRQNDNKDLSWGNKRKGNMLQNLTFNLKIAVIHIFNAPDIFNLRFAQSAKLLEPRSFSNIRREIFLERNTWPRKRDSPKKMAACALRRGLLSIVSKYNKRQIHRVLSIADSNSVFEVNRPSLQCQACGLSGGVQLRRFMSSR